MGCSFRPRMSARSSSISSVLSSYMRSSHCKRQVPGRAQLHEFSMHKDPVVQALQKYSSCDVSDALLKLGCPHGGFLSNLTLWSPERQAGPTKVIGPAYTVKYIKKDVRYVSSQGLIALPLEYHQRHYIDSVPSGSVLFISAPSDIVNAVYGGLMSTRAKYCRAAGTIVDGRIRDLQEHRDLGYAVFARDVGTASPQELLRVSEINTPVKLQSDIQNATISPGDYLIGDLNGVVCLPKGLAERAVALIASQVEADELIARDLNSGRTFSEASKERRAFVKMPSRPNSGGSVDKLSFDR